MAGSLRMAGIARPYLYLAILGLASACAGSPQPSVEAPAATPEEPVAPVMDAVMPPALAPSFPNGHAFCDQDFCSRETVVPCSREPIHQRQMPEQQGHVDAET